MDDINGNYYWYIISALTVCIVYFIVEMTALLIN